MIEVEHKPTRQKLIEAAAQAFNAGGYFGTDTNRIARAAGFAPQTFYRHFEDKLAVFIAVYDDWRESERLAVRAAARAPDPDLAIAQASLDHHVRWTGFRRSLRLLALEEPRVRDARTLSRRQQLGDLAKAPGNRGREPADLAAALLKVERVCDAAADGELADLGLGEAAILGLVIDAIRGARGRG
ncbi:AcrR family transcriptional regulator [Caulobacter ginsengisoli]|uniref:AcrR family transcriptional regulator n=1 Tax=Caulobacter ginsengisoli TaxID=400775 RepID=A0ABU0IKM4_9CAUL|nr:TetR/AcrR family transcriptional regulator [Caulobacter ginsengisoli]MDQ0462499.1 AcrR family transcriptional regulator [Caulobacter ginsengisoli]